MLLHSSALHKPHRIDRWQQLVSNHVTLALKSDPSPSFVNKTYALPFTAHNMLVASLAFCQHDRFGTPPNDHVLTKGLGLKEAPNNSNPAISPESPPLCAPCCCATQTGCAAYAAILQMYKFMTEKLRLNKILFSTFSLILCCFHLNCLSQ